MAIRRTELGVADSSSAGKRQSMLIHHGVGVPQGRCGEALIAQAYQPAIGSGVPARDEIVRTPFEYACRLERVNGRFARALLCNALAVVLVAGALWAPRAQALFAPESDLWERWTAHVSSATETIDHGAWDAFLERNLVIGDDGVNRIAYAKVSDSDRRQLDEYLASLSAIRISTYNRSEQRAYWINLYNALTVDVVLEHYPVESIRDISISPGLFSVGPWGKKLVTVEGQEISLDDIEHRILRPIWKDPRIHYAVNCASIGCPKLMPRAFTAANTEELLEQGARDFVNSERGARIDSEGRLIASSIYDWFQEDFGGSEAGVIAHLKRYAKPALAAELDGLEQVYGYEYDWSLNDAAPRAAPASRGAGSTNR